MEDGTFDYIIHGCNCYHIQGAGIAASIRFYYPDAYIEDTKTPYGDIEKLGSYSICKLPKFSIINAYTQFKPGRCDPLMLYTAIDDVFAKLSKDLPIESRIGIPKIGCGIAGGKWEIIKEIIHDHMGNHDLTVVNFKTPLLLQK